jgi:hypothetical protein
LFVCLFFFLHDFFLSLPFFFLLCSPLAPLFSVLHISPLFFVDFVVAWWLTIGNRLGFADLGLGLLNDPEHTHYTSLILLLVGLISCALVYTVLSVVLTQSSTASASELESFALIEGGGAVDGESGGVE